MTELEKNCLAVIDEKSDALLGLAATVWENPETAFKEFKSSAALKDFLRSEGFTVTEGQGGIPTAFVASFGSGKPELGFIAEFDALSGLSQKALATHPEVLPGVENGHGCGHHIYGGDAVAAALAVKKYLQSGKSGTVKVLG